MLTALILAGQDTHGGYAGAFLRFGMGARSVSMGNTGVAYSENGFAPFYQPAALPFLSQRHFSLSYYYLSLDRQLHFSGLSVPVKPSAGVAVSWLHGGVKQIQGRSLTGDPTETYETGEDVFILSFANAFHPQFSLGVNFKILRHQLLELTAQGLGFDVGLLFKPWSAITLGLQAKDMGAGYTWNTQKLFDEEGSNYTETFPRVYKFGIALQQHNFVFTGDVEYSSKQVLKTHFGGEYNFQNLAYLRLGFNDRFPTFGAGLAYGLIGQLDTRLDYGVIFNIAGEGETHIFAWEFQF